MIIVGESQREWMLKASSFFIFFLIENHHIKYTYNTIFLKILF